ncbi:multidrug efflux protein [Escherichia coli]|uniref:Multidrug efflux protein n=1 Tax=Escherichia coli TaxID=562 RepID=A0A377D3E2_ECOLX|nr:multidrug efflux protein [Escherichia coli]
MLLSVVVALTLTPALCGSVLQHVPPHKKGFFGAFNRFYRRTEDKYQRGVIYVLRRAARTMGLYVVLGGGMALMMWKNCRAVSYPLKTRAKSWCSTRCRLGRPLPVQQK